MKELFINHLYPSLWFIVLSVSVSCYVILDGFDLGIGVLYLLPKKDIDRKQLLKSIGPVWDGNEVWLIIIFGGLFAGFPAVYANLLSIFYLPIWYLVFFLIFRIISIEVRTKSEAFLWKKIWDGVFFVSSFLILVFLGCILGNLFHGVSLNLLDNDRQTMPSFFNVYSLLSGLFAVSLTALHGAFYAIIKVNEEFCLLLKKWIKGIFTVFVCFYVFLLSYFLVTDVYIRDKLFSNRLGMTFLLLSIISIVLIMLCTKKEKFVLSFLFSCSNIVWLVGTCFTVLYPDILRSSLNVSESLTIINSSASDTTLKILLVIVGIGLPFVFAYMFYIYKTFRGKVEISDSEY